MPILRRRVSSSSAQWVTMRTRPRPCLRLPAITRSRRLWTETGGRRSTFQVSPRSLIVTCKRRLRRPACACLARAPSSILHNAGCKALMHAASDRLARSHLLCRIHPHGLSNRCIHPELHLRQLGACRLHPSGAGRGAGPRSEDLTLLGAALSSQTESCHYSQCLMCCSARQVTTIRTLAANSSTVHWGYYSKTLTPKSALEQHNSAHPAGHSVYPTAMAQHHDLSRRTPLPASTVVTINSGDTVTVEMITHHAGDYFDGASTDLSAQLARPWPCCA